VTVSKASIRFGVNTNENAASLSYWGSGKICSFSVKIAKSGQSGLLAFADLRPPGLCRPAVRLSHPRLKSPDIDSLEVCTKIHLAPVAKIRPIPTLTVWAGAINRTIQQLHRRRSAWKFLTMSIIGPFTDKIFKLPLLQRRSKR
jgi:hypothetical protein